MNPPFYKAAIVHPGGLLGAKELANLKRLGAKTYSSSLVSKALAELEKSTPQAYRAKVLSVLDTRWGENSGSQNTLDAFVVGDGRQAYQQAVMFQITCNEKYAENAINIFKEWAAKAPTYSPKASSSGDPPQNAPLVWGWTLASWLKSAELLKYTYSKWDAKVERSLLDWIEREGVEQMWDKWILRPQKYSGNEFHVGNWHTTILEAKLYLAFLRDDKAGVDYVAKYYKRMIDGISNPANPQQTDQIYIAETGEVFETCRDTDHASYEVGGLVQLAEALFHQGIDLYNYGPKSSKSGLPGLANVLELWAYTSNNKAFPSDFKSSGTTWYDKPSNNFAHGSKCSKMDIGKIWKTGASFQIGFAHFGRRMGLQNKLPQLKSLASSSPDTYYFHWGLGALSHYSI